MVGDFPLRLWLLAHLVCRFIGHRWGWDHLEHEWAGDQAIHTASWHECARCEHYEETWNIYRDRP